MEIPTQTSQVQPEVKVHVIIDNSESMVDEQRQLAPGMDQLVTALANRANVSFEVRTMSANDDISSAGAKPTHTQSESYYTLDAYGNQVTLPGVPSAGSGPAQYYSARHFDLGRSLTNDPVRLSQGMSNAQVDAARTALSTTVSSVGISPDAHEDGMCAMSRILADPGRFSAGDKAAFLLISDDNDRSDDSRCSKDRVSDKFVLTGSEPYKHYTAAISGTITTNRPGTYYINYQYENKLKNLMGTYPRGTFVYEVSYDLPTRHTVTYRFAEGPWISDEEIAINYPFSGDCAGDTTIAAKLSGNNGKPLLYCTVTEIPNHKFTSGEIYHPISVGIDPNNPPPKGVRQECTTALVIMVGQGASVSDCKYYYDTFENPINMNGVMTSVPGGSPCSVDSALMQQVRDRYSIPASIASSSISCTVYAASGASGTYLYDDQAPQYGLVPEGSTCTPELLDYLRMLTGGSPITACEYRYTPPPSTTVTLNCRYDDSVADFSIDRCANNGSGLLDILKSNFYLACDRPQGGVYPSTFTSISGCQSSTQAGTTSYVAQTGTARVTSIKQALVPSAPASMTLSQAFATRANQLFGSNFLFASVIHNGTLTGGCPAGNPVAIGQTYMDLAALLTGQSQVTPICNPDYGSALTAIQNFVDSVTGNSYPMPALQPGEHLVGVRIRRGTQIIQANIPADVSVSGSNLIFRPGFLKPGDVVLVDIST